ncbi:hypothetical protein [Faecalicoccus pleomorphus]|nr:hypothetical protein [Faecalicoccus pleomorphus]
MSEILTCMMIDPYFCILAVLQFLSWIGFGLVAIARIHKVLFDRKDECYE